MSLKYTVEHEWVRPEGAVACVGITHHAQDALGDVVFVELPEVGSAFEQGAVAGNELRMVFQFVQGFGSGHEHGGAFGWQGSGISGGEKAVGERQQ